MIPTLAGRAREGTGLRWKLRLTAIVLVLSALPISTDTRCSSSFGPAIGYPAADVYRGDVD